MKIFYTLFLCLGTVLGFAQTKIFGKVTDTKGNPIQGANIFVEGTYDGGSSNEKGDFLFETQAKGNQVLQITFLSYETIKQNIVIESYKPRTYILKESANTLNEVVITAGTFEAGEKAKVTVLKPLDIVTTAGSNGDIIAALQTLPGTSTVGESGRLFVRGGEADEAQTYVDGLRVAQPYGAAAQNVPTRGRFSPFLFSGISFSTGGYSAEYGEALSSVLLLNTNDEESVEKTDISLMTVGLGLANTQVWKKNSLSVNAAYLNLQPYQALIPQNVTWNKPYQTLSGETVFRHKSEESLFKLYAAFDVSKFNLVQESINNPKNTEVDMNNQNFYLNTSYKYNLGNRWQLFSGLSFGLGENKIGLHVDRLHNTEHAYHLKTRLRKSFSKQLKLTFGADYFNTNFDENYNVFQTTDFQDGYKANIVAAFAETDIMLTKKMLLKTGLRFANNDYLHQSSIMPRVSFGYKVNKTSQFSLAYGLFEQAPNQAYLKFTNQLQNEKAAHYIFSYQYNKGSRTLKTEFYFKKYDNLIKYNTRLAEYNSTYTNLGNGDAKGFDLFWRDGKSIKNLEYWLSYSYLDTQRDYKNYANKVTPSFAAAHTLSLVTKYWINDLRSQVGFSHTFTSGRPYNNPNESVFMNGKTKVYNNLSFNWAYLISQQKILYFSVTNVLGTQNVYGYEYANTPNTNGIYDRKAITPTADRFFFVGFFWTISQDKKDNQLKNL